MARMKIEFRHAWQKSTASACAKTAGRDDAALGAVGGAPALARQSARRGAGLARLSRALARLLRAAPPAALARATRSARRGAAQAATASDADVVLLADTFNNYLEPENLQAALCGAAGRGLSRRGGARAGGASGSGRCAAAAPILAAGMVDEARHEAQRMLAALAPHVARGAAVVGLEPSCLLGLRDEYLALKLGADAQRWPRAVS